MKAKKFQLGLKLWSTNTNLISRVQELYDESVITHLEIHAVHKSFEETISKWSTLSIPYIIHAPNESVLDISDSSKLNHNKKIFLEVQHFADKLNATNIIVHPSQGNIAENIRQIVAFKEARICIENMPYYSLHNNQVLNGKSYGELARLLSETVSTFCLDIGHSIVAAHNLKIDYLAHLKNLISLKPSLLHLNDGYTNAAHDHHLHFGDGDFPLTKIIQMIPENSIISLETPKDINGNLSDFAQDIQYLKLL